VTDDEEELEYPETFGPAQTAAQPVQMVQVSIPSVMSFKAPDFYIPPHYNQHTGHQIAVPLIASYVFEDIINHIGLSHSHKPTASLRLRLALYEIDCTDHTSFVRSR
jgi:hypothetical protein